MCFFLLLTFNSTEQIRTGTKPGFSESYPSRKLAEPTRLRFGCLLGWASQGRLTVRNVLTGTAWEPCGRRSQLPGLRGTWETPGPIPTRRPTRKTVPSRCGWSAQTTEEIPRILSFIIPAATAACSRPLAHGRPRTLTAYTARSPARDRAEKQPCTPPKQVAPLPGGPLKFQQCQQQEAGIKNQQRCHAVQGGKVRFSFKEKNYFRQRCSSAL